MLVLEDLRQRKVSLRECVAAGEPLNPEIIGTVQQAWNITVRDGFGQTETTALVGNPPGQPIKPGSMGRPLPGYRIVLNNDLADPGAGEPQEGELAVDLSGPRPTGVMAGYADDDALWAEVSRGARYRTGDIVNRDADGFITYVGRADDVFKASDYRISPFELESVLLEHPSVAEAAVVPSPDPVRLAVPKAFVVLRPEVSHSAELGRELLAFVQERVAPFKRIRRLEFAMQAGATLAAALTVLPKTISGKIRRVELRLLEADRNLAEGPKANEVWDHG
jgi:acetyl-CoA synthetase